MYLIQIVDENDGNSIIVVPKKKIDDPLAKKLEKGMSKGLEEFLSDMEKKHKIKDGSVLPHCKIVKSFCLNIVDY